MRRRSVRRSSRFRRKRRPASGKARTLRRIVRRAHRSLGRKRQQRAGRRANVRRGVFSYRLRGLPGDTTTVAVLPQEDSVRNPSDFGQLDRLAPTPDVGPNALRENYRCWPLKPNQFQGFAQLSGLYRYYLVRGYKLTFRPSWTQVGIADVRAADAGSADVPRLMWRINRDPNSRPPPTVGAGGEVARWFANQRGVHYHDFRRGRTLKVYCSRPTIPSSIMFWKFRQGGDAALNQGPTVGYWSDWTTGDDGSPGYMAAPGRARWMPTDADKNTDGDPLTPAYDPTDLTDMTYLGIETCWERPWVDAAARPIIQVQASLWIDFREWNLDYNTVSGVEPVE